MPQNGAHQSAETRLTRQILAVAGDVDPGQHRLAGAVLDEHADLLDDDAHRDRARIAAAIGNDAEGAAMVAAVLDLHEGARAPLHPVDQMRGGLAHGHDVVDDDLFALTDTEGLQLLPGPGLHLLVIAHDLRHFRHGGEGPGLDLGGAAGDDDARVGAFAGDAADALAGLARGFRRDRAGIDDDGVLEAGLAGLTLHRLGLVGVEPAAECDKIDAHGPCIVTSCGARGGGRVMRSCDPRILPSCGPAHRYAPSHTAPAKISAGNRSSHSISTGPVISTWESLSRQVMSRSPPGRLTSASRPVNLRRAAATSAAQAADPQARVSPAPRSQTLSRM